MCNCKEHPLINFSEFTEKRGMLTVVDFNKDLPFDIDCSVPYTIEKAECFDGETKILDLNFNK